MDNISSYYIERIKPMYYNTRIKILYLLLYSPNLNPFEEYFAELKAFIKRNWQVYEANSSQDFNEFLE